MSTKYRFDMRLGHYVSILNEGEQPQDNTQSQEQTQDNKQVEQKPSVVLVNLQTPEIVQMQKDKETKVQNVLAEINKKNNNVIQIQNKLAQLQNNNLVDQKGLNTVQKELLQAQYELETAKFNLAKCEQEENQKILQAQQKLIESREVKYILPEKYKYLNESNIQKAKVHFDKLIKEDPHERIKGMVDFKKAFGESELLYGKDKNGYFAVCVDQEDLNKLTSTLEEAGFLRDDILAQVLPQIFDRSNLTT